MAQSAEIVLNDLDIEAQMIDDRFDPMTVGRALDSVQLHSGSPPAFHDGGRLEPAALFKTNEDGRRIRGKCLPLSRILRGVSNVQVFDAQRTRWLK